MFVGCVRVTWVVQLLPPLSVNCVQPLLFNWNQTLRTATLSAAVPVTVSAALVSVAFGTGEVIATVGRFVSAKFAVKVRFDAITNVRMGFVVVRLPVQLVKAKPGFAVAVTE